VTDVASTNEQAARPSTTVRGAVASAAGYGGQQPIGD
jgi:hypothetical protein